MANNGVILSSKGKTGVFGKTFGSGGTHPPKLSESIQWLIGNDGGRLTDKYSAIQPPPVVKNIPCIQFDGDTTHLKIGSNLAYGTSDFEITVIDQIGDVFETTPSSILGWDVNDKGVRIIVTGQDGDMYFSVNEQDIHFPVSEYMDGKFHEFKLKRTGDTLYAIVDGVTKGTVNIAGESLEGGNYCLHAYGTGTSGHLSGKCAYFKATDMCEYSLQEGAGKEIYDLLFNYSPGELQINGTYDEALIEWMRAGRVNEMTHISTDGNQRWFESSRLPETIDMVEFDLFLEHRIDRNSSWTPISLDGTSEMMIEFGYNAHSELEDFTFGVDDNDTDSVSYITEPIPAGWHRFKLVWEQDRYQIYIDGLKKETHIFGTPENHYGHQVYVGYAQGNMWQISKVAYLKLNHDVLLENGHFHQSITNEGAVKHEFQDIWKSFNLKNGYSLKDVALNGDFSEWDDTNHPTDWHVNGLNATNYVEQVPEGCRFVSDGTNFSLGQNVLEKSTRYDYEIYVHSVTGDGVSIRLGSTTGGTNQPEGSMVVIKTLGLHKGTLTCTTLANTLYISRDGATDITFSGLKMKAHNSLVPALPGGNRDVLGNYLTNEPNLVHNGCQVWLAQESPRIIDTIMMNGIKLYYGGLHNGKGRYIREDSEEGDSLYWDGTKWIATDNSGGYMDENTKHFGDVPPSNDDWNNGTVVQYLSQWVSESGEFENRSYWNFRTSKNVEGEEVNRWKYQTTGGLCGLEESIVYKQGTLDTFTDYDYLKVYEWVNEPCQAMPSYVSELMAKLLDNGDGITPTETIGELAPFKYGDRGALRFDGIGDTLRMEADAQSYQGTLFITLCDTVFDEVDGHKRCMVCKGRGTTNIQNQGIQIECADGTETELNLLSRWGTYPYDFSAYAIPAPEDKIFRMAISYDASTENPRCKMWVNGVEYPVSIDISSYAPEYVDFYELMTWAVINQEWGESTLVHCAALDYYTEYSYLEDYTNGNYDAVPTNCFWNLPVQEIGGDDVYDVSENGNNGKLITTSGIDTMRAVRVDGFPSWNITKGFYGENTVTTNLEGANSRQIVTMKNPVDLGKKDFRFSMVGRVQDHENLYYKPFLGQWYSAYDGKVCLRFNGEHNLYACYYTLAGDYENVPVFLTIENAKNQFCKFDLFRIGDTMYAQGITQDGVVHKTSKLLPQGVDTEFGSFDWGFGGIGLPIDTVWAKFEVDGVVEAEWNCSDYTGDELTDLSGHGNNGVPNASYVEFGNTSRNDLGIFSEYLAPYYKRYLPALNDESLAVEGKPITNPPALMNGAEVTIRATYDVNLVDAVWSAHPDTGVWYIIPFTGLGTEDYPRYVANYDGCDFTLEFYQTGQYTGYWRLWRFYDGTMHETGLTNSFDFRGHPHPFPPNTYPKVCLNNSFFVDDDTGELARKTYGDFLWRENGAEDQIDKWEESLHNYECLMTESYIYKIGTVQGFNPLEEKYIQQLVGDCNPFVPQSGYYKILRDADGNVIYGAGRTVIVMEN